MVSDYYCCFLHLYVLFKHHRFFIVQILIHAFWSWSCSDLCGKSQNLTNNIVSHDFDNQIHLNKVQLPKACMQLRDI